MKNPKYYRLPYQEFRPGQLETIEWVRDSESQYIISEQPTGSGKSAVPLAAGLGQRVIALTESRNLQSQYADVFNTVHAHFGKSNYACVHPNRAIDVMTADECMYSGCASAIIIASVRT